MPKKTAAPSALPPLKFPGKTFAFVGKLYPSVRREITQLIEVEGGKVVKNVTAGLDFLLMAEPCPRGQWAAEKKAERPSSAAAAAPRAVNTEKPGSRPPSAVAAGSAPSQR
ncbi:MAG: hypothetical protein L0Z62_26605 [Gemmataceae bacterium]|nr:hypothetical protein [Gemmataceae bacterium]